MTATRTILKEIAQERQRQSWLREQGKFTATLADVDAAGESVLSPTQKLAVLAEEVGEVARCALALERLVHEPDDVRSLRTELIQVAALAVAWLEALPEE